MENLKRDDIAVSSFSEDYINKISKLTMLPDADDMHAMIVKANLSSELMKLTAKYNELIIELINKVIDDVVPVDELDVNGLEKNSTEFIDSQLKKTEGNQLQYLVTDIKTIKLKIALFEDLCNVKYADTPNMSDFLDLYEDFDESDEL